jgi:uncharacterized membrane protein (UPF0182 family)
MRTPLPRVSRRGRFVVVLLLALLVILTVGSWVVTTWTDWLWFDEVDYTSVFTTTLYTKLLLFLIFGLVAAVWLGGHVYAAFRLRPRQRPNSVEQQNLDRYRMMLTPRIRLWIGLLAIITGVITGLSAQGQWQQWLLYANSQKFDSTDPQFHANIGYYVFDYPWYRYLVGVGFTLVFVALIAALFTHWLYGGVRLSGRGDRITASARLHLSLLVAAFVALKAVAYLLDQRGLLLGYNGVTGLDGAGYTAINALLPAKQILTWVAVVVAIGVIVFSNAVMRNLIWPGVSLALLAIAAVTIGGIYPAMVSSFTVKPNIAAKESRYIDRTIKATRSAYGLSGVDEQAYNVDTKASPANLSSDSNTVGNVRLMDPSKVSDTFTQLQKVRGFYDFGQKLNIDRYTVDGVTQDYVVGVRELDSAKLTGTQRNWQNSHTVFTHGYGFVAAPADEVCNQQPHFVSGALVYAGSSDNPASSDACTASTDQIKVRYPRIYYGNQISDYSIVGKASDGKANREYDYPTGANSQAQNTYDGSGGVPVGSFGRRLLYALNFKDVNFLLSSDYFNGNSKVLYVRNPRDRVEKVAPFLKVDGDPYPAVVDGHVVWILDGYTTASTYPYAQRTDLRSATSDSLTGAGTTPQQKQDINYIRNSVKATVDAYTGKVTLYSFDSKDPVLKAWNAAFGGIIKPLSAASPDLVAHFRYPEDLFKVQRDVLTEFHVTDPGSFNSSENFWSVPQDPSNTGTKQPPYYVVAQYPGQSAATFQLTASVTQRNQGNLSAMLSAYYDSAGKPHFNVLDLRGNATINGPGQIAPKLQNQSGIRTQLTTSDSRNSKLDYGNLLILPVQNSLLYVEPVFIKGVDVAYPLLSLVLVSFGQQVGYGANLTDAIASLNASTTGTSPPPNSGSTGTNPPNNTQVSPAVAAALAQINKALADLKTAQQSGSYEAQGRAMDELQKAIQAYNQATKTATTTPSGTPSPSPSTR